MNLPREINKLSDDLVTAFYELDEYSLIFRESKERIDLLNKVAPSFFVKLHDLFWNNFIMTVSRFTDPGYHSKNQNLSLDILILHQNDLNQNDQDNLRDNLATIKTEAGQIRAFRSKYISHRDLDYALLNKDDIGAIDLKKIENIYRHIAECLNIFNMHYNKRTILYQGLAVNPGARSLIYYIKEGVIYNEFKTRRKNLWLNEEESNQSKFKDS